MLNFYHPIFKTPIPKTNPNFFSFYDENFFSIFFTFSYLLTTSKSTSAKNKYQKIKKYFEQQTTESISFPVNALLVLPTILSTPSSFTLFAFIYYKSLSGPFISSSESLSHELNLSREEILFSLSELEELNIIQIQGTHLLKLSCTQF